MNLILQRAHFIHCSRSAYPGPEPRDHMALMHVVPGIVCGHKSRSIRYPHLHPGVGIRERAGQHADHFVGCTIQPYLLADDRGVSCETPLEEAPCKQNYMVGSNSIFLRPEGAAQRRRYTQDGEEVPGTSRTLDNLWKLRMLAGEIETFREGGSHIREAMRPLMPIVEIS